MSTWLTMTVIIVLSVALWGDHRRNIQQREDFERRNGATPSPSPGARAQTNDRHVPVGESRRGSAPLPRNVPRRRAGRGLPIQR